MSRTDRGRDPLRTYSSVLFLSAGGLLTIFAINTGFEIYGESAYPIARDVFGPAGFGLSALAFLSILGAIARTRSWLAWMGAALAAVTAGGWFVVAAIGVGDTIGVLPDAEVVLPLAAFFALFFVTPITFFTIGVAGVAADGIPRWLGVLLMVPAIPFLVLLFGGGVLAAVTWAELALDAGHATANLVIGITLFRARLLLDRAEGATDVTT